MGTCRICLRTFKKLRFDTEHISVCTRCVNMLNQSPEPAERAEARFAEKLARGMVRNAEQDLRDATEDWQRRRARKTLEDVDSAVAAKLHEWITRLLAKPGNNERDYKIMRAHRRGLLRRAVVADRPGNWPEVAKRIRHRDGYLCMLCRAGDTTLDVHHIVYLSHYGTNQQSNLVTLCRACHEAEHERAFDLQEEELVKQPAVASPPAHPPAVVQPKPPPSTPAPAPATQDRLTLRSAPPHRVAESQPPVEAPSMRGTVLLFAIAAVVALPALLGLAGLFARVFGWR